MPMILTHVNQTLVKDIAQGRRGKKPVHQPNNILSKISHSLCFSKDQWVHLYVYCQTSNISHTLAVNKITDHSNVVGASHVGAAPTTSWSTLTPGFNWLNKDNGKMRPASFKIWDSMHLTLEISDLTVFTKKYLFALDYTMDVLLVSGQQTKPDILSCQRPLQPRYAIFGHIHTGHSHWQFGGSWKV